MGSLDVDARGTLKDLNDSFLSGDFEDLTATFGSIGESQLYDFVVRWELGTKDI